MTQYQKRERGFTIIEVLIVLAIAGLILLIVFFAIPEIQRVQRNAERKNGVAHVTAELNTYLANRGRYPMSGTLPSQDQRATFVADLVNNPVMRNFTINYGTNGLSHQYPYSGSGSPANPEETLDEITILPAHKCNRDPTVGPGDVDYPAASTSLGDTNFNTYAVWTVLERGPAFCVDSEG